VAYAGAMDLGRLLKWLAVIAVIVIVWKVVLPRLNGPNIEPGRTKSSSSVPDTNCVRRAEAASEAWGRSLRQFGSPPYDLSAWSSFRSEVDGKIDAAVSDCNCTFESCRKAGEAMRDLRSLVSEMYSAIRNGSSPPDDSVQRQEQIDNLINEAGDLARGGK
jgi:hypothetical protein